MGRPNFTNSLWPGYIPGVPLLYALATAAALVLRFAPVIIKVATLSPFYVNADELGLPSVALPCVAL